MQRLDIDYLVVGGGIAGLQAALAVCGHGRVAVVNKGDGCSSLAQGGIAVAQDDEDAERLHLEDTLRAGKGECDPEPVRLMVAEGPARVAELIELGASFDRDELGAFLLAREGAHSRRRILRAGGDATGREIVRTLKAAVADRDAITEMNGHFVSELLQQDGRVVGALLLPSGGSGADDAVVVTCGAVLLAAGGAGQVYRRTSNPATATGDGIAMAVRAGAELRHMEFVQFHPTVLAEPYPPFLLSEAMRGEGGILRNAAGEAFMERYHPQRDLAPRDEVARAIWREMGEEGRSAVCLDMRGVGRERLKDRFPNIYRTCAALGIDIAAEPVPVMPAAHFVMGGVRTDVCGRASVPGLYAMGEVACSGVHGANRLASNSLLEALVFGTRGGVAAVRDGEGLRLDRGRAAEAAERLAGARRPVPAALVRRTREMVRETMWRQVGVMRDSVGLGGALERFESALAGYPFDPFDSRAMEAMNLLTVARAITGAALARRVGVGAHYRSDDHQRDGTVAAAG